MGNSQAANTEIIRYDAVDMPRPPSTSAPEPLSFALRTASIFPLSESTPSLPKSVLMEIHSWGAEIFDDDRNASPILRWSSCNILSWGYNKSGISIVVVSDELMSPAAYRNCARTERSNQRRIVRKHVTYAFKTAQGAEIAAVFLRIADGLAEELLGALTVKESQVLLSFPEADVQREQRTVAGLLASTRTRKEPQTGLQCRPLQSRKRGHSQYMYALRDNLCKMEYSMQDMLSRQRREQESEKSEVYSSKGDALVGVVRVMVASSLKGNHKRRKRWKSNVW